MVMLASAGLLAVVIQTTSSSGRSANLLEARVTAESLAEDGLAMAFSTLNFDGNSPTDPTLLGCNADGSSCTPITPPADAGGVKGTSTYYGVLSLVNSEWAITATGQVPNPTGAAPVKVTLNASVPLVITTGDPNAAAWNYLFATKEPAAGCEVDVAGSNVVIDMPVYVRGDLCVTGSNAMIDERGEGQTPAPSPIDLQVGGKLVIAGSNNATVGVPSDYLTSAGIALGCTNSISGTPHTCVNGSADDYYVTSSTSFTVIDAPVPDIATWFGAADTINSTAAVGGDCTVRAGTPPNINPDAVLDADAGTINLTPGSSYTCRKVVNGVTVAELSWNGSTTLTIKGVIVVDGNMQSTDELATYAGSASIYANGTFSLNASNAKLCATSTCNFTNWNPNTEMLVVVANNVTFQNGSNNAYQGGLLCPTTGSVHVGGSNAIIHGPVICGTFNFASSSNVEFKPMPPITQVPLGAPVDYNVEVAPGTPSYGS